MWLDVITAVIFVGSAALGFRRGLFSTAIHTFGWASAVILGFAWSPAINLFLRDHTGLFESLQNAVSAKLLESGETAVDPLAGSLPKILSDALEQASRDLLLSAAAEITGLLFQILVFLGAAILVGLLFSLFSKVFSQKKGRCGFLSFGDGAAGLLIGCTRGILLVFLFLAFLVPMEIIVPGDKIQTALAASHIAADLYDNNLLLLLAKNTF